MDVDSRFAAGLHALSNRRSNFSEWAPNSKPCKEGLSEDDPFVPLALTVLGVFAWSLMAILGALLDQVNRDAGVAVFDTWLSRSDTSPERYGGLA